MPSYSYRCEACRKTFTMQMSLSEHEKARTKCPKCGSRKTVQQIGSFSAITSKKS